MVNLLAIPTFFSLGIMNVALVDIIALVCGIIALIVGYCRGFMQQVLSLLGKIAALLIAFFFCSTFATMVCDLIPAIPQAVEGWVEGVFGEGLNATFENKEQIMMVLKQSSVPVFLHEVLANAVVNSNFEFNLIPIISKFILNIISFVLLYFLSLLVFVLLKKIFKQITDLRVVKYFDKFLGVILSLIKLLLIFVILAIVLSLFLPINDYLKPDGAFCVFNSILEYVMQMQFIEKLILMIA